MFYLPNQKPSREADSPRPADDASHSSHHDPIDQCGELTPQEFFRRTIDTWQPRSEKHLTLEDAREIISNASGFFRVLAEWDRADEAKRAPERSDEP